MSDPSLVTAPIHARLRSRNGDRPPDSTSGLTPGSLALGAVLFVLFSGADRATAAASWETECAEPATMPAIERTIAPVPQAGKWRAKGFGDKRKLDVEIEECGRKIVGMVGVRLKHVADWTIPLELDDDGRYKARFSSTEGGVTVVVTWDLEAESESRVTGRMTIMGRGDRVEVDLLEAAPSPELARCECEAVRQRRDALAERLSRLREDPEPIDDLVRGWTTDPNSCAIRPLAPEWTLPTQETFETLMRADWEAELVFRERCCAGHRKVAGVGESGASGDTASGGVSLEEAASDRIAALTAAIRPLDEWLEDRCNQTPRE